MDNYYTRHTFANALAKITDGTSRVCGTIKFTNVDSTNRVYVRKGIAQLKNAPRGCWLLVRAYNPHPNLTDLRNKHNSEQKKQSPSDRVPFSPPTNLISDNAGYILLKDSKVVIFYSNDLAGTATEAILTSSSAEAIALVHGLAKLYRWTGAEMLQRMSFDVPAIIIAYNTYMSTVNWMDQRRSTNPT